MSSKSVGECRKISCRLTDGQVVSLSNTKNARYKQRRLKVNEVVLLEKLGMETMHLIMQTQSVNVYSVRALRSLKFAG